jgi:hypothetical protein
MASALTWLVLQKVKFFSGEDALQGSEEKKYGTVWNELVRGMAGDAKTRRKASERGAYWYLPRLHKA